MSSRTTTHAPRPPMLLTVYLTVSRAGQVRVTKNRPRQEPDEITLELPLTLPRELFDRPTLRASVTVPPEAVPPMEISADVIASVGEAVRQATGLDVRVVLEPPE